jgi:hypothetical protein
MKTHTPDRCAIAMIAILYIMTTFLAGCTLVIY